MSPRKVLSEHKLERVLPWREFSEVFCREAIAASLTCAIAIAAREDFALVQDYLLEQAVAPDAVNKASPRAQDIRAAPGSRKRSGRLRKHPTATSHRSHAGQSNKRNAHSA
jgi:hypothetical protein